MAHMNEPSSWISLNNRDLPHQALLFSLFSLIPSYLSDFHPDDFEGAQNIYSTVSHSREMKETYCLISVHL